MKIGANGAACDAVDFPVQIGSGVEVGGDGVGRQARVIGVAYRVVTPKCGSRSEVLVYAPKEVDVGAVACSAKPATRCRKRSDRCPGIVRGVYL